MPTTRAPRVALLLFGAVAFFALALLFLLRPTAAHAAPLDVPGAKPPGVPAQPPKPAVAATPHVPAVAAKATPAPAATPQKSVTLPAPAPANVDTPKVDTPKVAPNVDTPKIDTPNVDTPKIDTPSIDTPILDDAIDSGAPTVERTWRPAATRLATTTIELARTSIAAWTPPVANAAPPRAPVLANPLVVTSIAPPTSAPIVAAAAPADDFAGTLLQTTLKIAPTRGHRATPGPRPPAPTSNALAPSPPSPSMAATASAATIARGATLHALATPLRPATPALPFDAPTPPAMPGPIGSSTPGGNSQSEQFPTNLAVLGVLAAITLGAGRKLYLSPVTWNPASLVCLLERPG
jgi:hypothetical protein